MRRANVELHQNLVRVRGQCTAAKKKLAQAVHKGEVLKQIAVTREKVYNLQIF
jgi:hypothetical protein